MLKVENDAMAVARRRDQALDMLDDLDVRHDSLLSELDALGHRIESVLGQFVKITPQVAEDGIPAPETI